MKTFAVLVTAVLTHAIAAQAADVATFIDLPVRFVIGGHSKGKWLTSEQAGKSIKPGTPFRLFTLKGDRGKVNVTKTTPEPDVCMDVWMTELDEVIENGCIAVSAPWNPMPRAVKVGDTKQVKAVSEILTANGIKKPLVKIKQLLRVDLDGDGEEEVLLTATNYSKAEEGTAPNAASAGNYSFVALRRVIDGKVDTQIIEGEFYPKTMDFNAPNFYEIGGVLDLDGDGKMEIVLESQYYEGGGTTAWKLGKKKAEKVLEIACGV